MTENSLSASRTPLALDLLTRFVVRIGERLLTSQPAGAILIVLPNGQRMSFGNERPHDAVLTLKNYRVLRKSIRRGALGLA